MDSVIAEQLAEMSRAADNRAYAAIRAGGLTPEKAQQLWVEKYEIVRLGEKLAASARVTAARDPLIQIKGS